MKKVCDKKFHCKDESDEEESYCKYKCKADQFTCDNGNCISIFHRCDGDNDCYDGSDEVPDRCLGKVGDITCILSCCICSVYGLGG